MFVKTMSLYNLINLWVNRMTDCMYTYNTSIGLYVSIYRWTFPTFASPILTLFLSDVDITCLSAAASGQQPACFSGGRWRFKKFVFWSGSFNFYGFPRTDKEVALFRLKISQSTKFVLEWIKTISISKLSNFLMTIIRLQAASVVGDERVCWKKPTYGDLVS